VLLVGAGGVPAGGGVGSGVSSRRRVGGGAPVPLLLECFADSLGCHFSKEGSPMFGFAEALPGVFVSQPSPSYSLQTQHHTSSVC
jgi:hypothetical protein